MTTTDLRSTRLAVLGAGNMGTAIILGALRAGVMPQNIAFTTLDDGAAETLTNQCQLERKGSNAKAVNNADVVVVAVKPNDVPDVLTEISPAIAPDAIVVSVAVGINLGTLLLNLPAKQPAIRAMPNTPAAVGKGVTALSPNSATSPKQLQLVEQIFKGAGTVVVVPENYQTAVGAISGSGPAFVAYFLDGLIEAAVHQGLPRALATELAIDTVAGTAAMLAETGEHPAIARERVTSPGGTTAAGLAELEDAGVRGAIMRAVAASVRRTNEIQRG